MSEEVLKINEAAYFLRLNKEVLRRKANAGEIPGQKLGKWLFLKSELINYLSNGYNTRGKTLQANKQGDKKCQLVKQQRATGLTFRSKESDYKKLLNAVAGKKQKP